MTSADITNAIKALREESAKIQTHDDTANNFDQLIDQLESKISTEQSQSISEHISTMVETTEAHHPKLTLILNDLMVKLASIGV